MGIKYLWTVLTPFCERKPLYELRDKTVAIDLSCWICEAQNIAEYEIQPRMYLRNLYFRTCYLLLMDVNPVFVLEGKAPELKYDTIAARNAIQFKGSKPKKDGVKTGKDRTRFHFILKRCEEMLRLMGLACIKGNGEAESMCAYLNEEGLVDGCISQDSDCFAYGAKIVYRNFSISSQGAYSASGGAIDIYDIQKAYEKMDFGRNKIITMALLCGSDYSDGVQGVGKESVMKLFETVSDNEILKRIRSWRSEIKLYEKFESQVSDKNICSSCGHQGKIQSHSKNGCLSCKTTKGCDPFRFKEERLNIKNELNMRKKALEDPEFPNESLINEFLVKKDFVSKLDLKWRQPNLIGFVNFTMNFLQWELIYSFEKILPILTRWHCLNYVEIEKNSKLKGVLKPERIKKPRNPKGIPSFEIIWSDPSGCFKGLIPEQQLIENNVDLEKLWSTIEPQVLVERAYPRLVEDFKQSKIKPKKPSKRKKKETIQNSSLSEPSEKKTRKPKKVKSKEMEELESSLKELEIKPKKKTATLDSFLKKAVLNNQKQALQGFGQTSTPAKSNKSSELDFSSFLEDNDDCDLSDIIEGIISRKPDYIKNLKKNNLDVSENEKESNEVDSSSFFINNPVENDLFEQTFDMRDENDGESTEEYEYDENMREVENGDENKENYDLQNNESNDSNKEKCNEYNTVENKEKGNENNKVESKDKSDEEDSFCDNYVPLLERLKKLK